ncbi:hypothetical protein BEL04_22990 [Mucilaginibacter sp. PPCGB 2223]|uniref:DUF5004 domain-containing protein n=1 Tax=Mucilaginibacter sp. PPCGB 2223 TaxID=1886027 RepID=UPI0008246B04|nr:DUF5004 domain-containing protein [Mucilaginibacter sp. PPCGB 2223]OCX50640.1 hypothetical protein BEL04_22990 [Mucilaginibacter sp. PPCGB 2223]
MFITAKYKVPFFALLCLAAVTLFFNSCKKDNGDTLAYFLTNGKWTLASVTVLHYVGDTQGKTDTLNATCAADQVYIFNADGTCSYSNYHCITQNSSGTWNVDQDNLTLSCNMSAQDTSKGNKVTVKAFQAALIDNLGQYSLVLKTGDIQAYYKATTVRTITRYGFVHSR